MHFPYPLLVCDVGGTNVRIGVVEDRSAAVRRIGNERTAPHSSLQATIKATQERAKVGARSLLVCAAGPIEGRIVYLTNANWTIDGPQIAGALGLDQGLLLNDFEAQAIALPHLPPKWTRAIGGGTAAPKAPQLVLGPGTGFGAAALLRAGDAWLPLTTEAGHVAFGPSDAGEERIWRHLESVDGRVTFESVLSGPGLARLHSALRKARALPALACAAPEIVSAATAGDSAAVETMRLFWRLVARCAGDLALIFLARGGVTLSGGVLPRLVDWLDPDDFRRAFSAKAPMTGLVSEIPVRLQTEPDAALVGLAALAADPESYVIDYPARAWRR